MANSSDWEKQEGWTRRDWVKLGLAVGGSAAAGAVGVGLAEKLLRSPPPEPIEGPILYTRFPMDQWWNSYEGNPVKVTDFQEWQGATGVLGGTFASGKWVAGTGYPVLRGISGSSSCTTAAPISAVIPDGRSSRFRRRLATTWGRRRRTRCTASIRSIASVTDPNMIRCYWSRARTPTTASTSLDRPGYTVPRLVQFRSSRCEPWTMRFRRPSSIPRGTGIVDPPRVANRSGNGRVERLI